MKGDNAIVRIPQWRWYFYICLMVGFILIAFYSGYRLGRTVEREEWIDIIDPKFIPEAKQEV
jgi:hypothetical protein